MNWPAVDEQAKPCPNCGSVPVLNERWQYGTRLLLIYWYECRRWLGLRLCRRGQAVTMEKDWSDVARRYAAQHWNQR